MAEPAAGKLISQRLLVFLACAALLTAAALWLVDQRDSERFPPEPMLLATAPTSAVEPLVREVPITTVPQVSSIVAADAGSVDEPGTALTAPEDVDGFATVGVSWGSSPTVEETTVNVLLRVLDDGQWSEWELMPYDAEHGPDADGREGLTARTGTDPMAVGYAEQVQVKVVSRDQNLPTDLSLSLIDPGTPQGTETQEPELDPANNSTSDNAVLTRGTPTAAPQPKIFSREQWGADESMRDRGSLRYGTIRAGFVHHTVNANDYSRDDVPAIIRGIYAYHTQSLGWSDIGYNFLVDRFGRIWEGRFGGIDKAVVGAHTLGYNEESFAMSAIGNMETARPTAALLDAYKSLFAWKLSLHGVAADDPRQSVSGDVFPAISGHRDAGQTACPGQYLYARLSDIRKGAAAMQRAPSPPQADGSPLDANLSGSRWPDMVVRDASTKRAYIVRTGGQLGFLAPVRSDVRLRGKDLVTSAGDVNRDGWTDVLARSGASGITRLFTGSSQGLLKRSDRSYKRFADMDELTSVGDMNRDGYADLVGRRSSRLVMVPGRRKPMSFGREQVLSRRSVGLDGIMGVGDVDGDGYPDLAVRDDDSLWLARGSASGLARARAVPGRWGQYDRMAAGADLTFDGLPDVLARNASSGRTYVLPGDGNGGWGAALGGWSFVGAGERMVVGKFVAGRPTDLLTIDAKGSVATHSHNGRTNVAGLLDTGQAFKGIDLLLNVGDWNGDDRGDIMTRRSSTGSLQLRLGRRGDRFSRPSVVGRGWNGVSLIAAVGDVTGDGNPDVMGRRADGSNRIYPGDGNRGFLPSRPVDGVITGRHRVYVGLWDADNVPDTAARRRDGTLWLYGSRKAEPREIASGLRRYDWLVGVGDLNGDRRADLIARTRATGTLWMLPGGRTKFGEPRSIAAEFGRFDLAG